MSLTDFKKFKEQAVSKVFLQHQSKKLGVPGMEYEQLNDELMYLAPKDEFTMKVTFKDNDISIRESETFEEYLYRSQKPIAIDNKIIINGVEVDSSEFVKGIHENFTSGRMVLIPKLVVEITTLNLKFGLYNENIDFRHISSDEEGNFIFESINCPMKITYFMKDSQTMKLNFQLGKLSSIEDKIFTQEFILALYEKEIIIEDIFKCKIKNDINLQTIKDELKFCSKVQKLQEAMGCEFEYSKIFEDKDYLERLYINLIQKNINKTYLKDFTLTFGIGSNIVELKKMVDKSYGLCFEGRSELETNNKRVNIYTAYFLADSKVLSVEEYNDKVLVNFVPLKEELLLVERNFLDINEMQAFCKDIKDDFAAFYIKVMNEEREFNIVAGGEFSENRN